MMTGPTLGNNSAEQEKPKNEQLFDALQINIVELGEEARLRGLFFSFSDLRELASVPGDLHEFSLDVRNGNLSNDEVVEKLENICVKALKSLGRVSDVMLQQKGTTYTSARSAIIKHFYKMSRNFGVQLELSSRLDKWSKEFPHSEDPKEQTFQEQKEEAFKSVDSRFGTMYATVTKEQGYDSKKVVDGCLKHIDEIMVGHSGALANFFGVAHNFTLAPYEKEKRVTLMKEKLKTMVEDALVRDARKATGVVFEKLANEFLLSDQTVQGSTAASIAEMMITRAINKRAKSSNGKYEEYKPLAYYWPSDVSEHRDVIELYQDLIYLTQRKWGAALHNEKNSAERFEKARVRIDNDPEYFEGYKAPKPHLVRDEQTPETVREGTKNAAQQNGGAHTAPTPQELVVSGEGTGLIDIAALRAQQKQQAVAAKVGSGNPENYSHSVVATPAPTRTPSAPQPDKKVIVADPSVVIENRGERRTIPEIRSARTAVEQAQTEPQPLPVPDQRPQRPDIQFPKQDQEITQTSQHNKARKGRFSTWVRRGMFAVAAALGISVAGAAAYKAYNAHEGKTASSEVAKNPAAAKTSVAPSTKATTAPVSPQDTSAVSSKPTAAPSAVAVNPVPAPNVSSTSGVQETAPKVTSVLGSYSYDLGTSNGAKAFTGIASMVEGGVDATPFATNEKTPTWYQSQQKAAQVLMEIYDKDQSRLDKNTVDFVKTHEKMVRELSSQTLFSASQFKANFENHYGPQALYGSKGVYNRLLALERIMDLYGNDTVRMQKDSAKIQLSLGGRMAAPDERFAKAVVLEAPPSNDPAPQNVAPNNGGQQQNAPQQNGKSGFNMYQQAPHNVVPGTMPVNVAPGLAPVDSKYADAIPSKFRPNSSSNVRTKFLDDWKAREAKKVEDAKVAANLLRMREDILASNAADMAQKAAGERKAIAAINELRDQINAAEKAEKEAKVAAKKAALRSELDTKMEKLFARTKQRELERANGPALDIQKTYHVTPSQKSIKFVLAHQIEASRLSPEAKEAAKVAVQEMIRSNGAFIESYKMNRDGSRDLTLKDEWIAQLNKAAGIQAAVTTEVELTDSDIIGVIEPGAKAA